MKKLFLGVVICIIAALSVMGCGKQEGTGGSSGHEHPTSEHPR